MKHNILIIISLYIFPSLYPTWFRWNEIKHPLYKKGESLYIPHGSDETDYCPRAPFIRCILYIPHGSDETVATQEVDLTPYHFISHMVQMKLVGIKALATDQLSFISHMVQMKRIGGRRWGRGSELYIPHGSDETIKPKPCLPYLVIFISHMVQMKPVNNLSIIMIIC